MSDKTLKKVARMSIDVNQLVKERENALKRQSDKKEKKKKKSFFGRAFQLGTGVGIMRGNLPLVTSGLAGRGEFWHGTPSNNLPGIFESGLDVSHSGKNRRLNSVLLKETFMRDAESYLKTKNIKVTPEISRKLFGATEKFIASIPDGKSISEHIESVAPEIANKIGVSPDDFSKHIKSSLSDFGKRIYFATNPESVTYWSKVDHKGTPLNEAQYALSSMSSQIAPSATLKHHLKNQAQAFADQTTGGYFTDTVAKMRYGRPKDTVHVENLADALKTIQQTGNRNVVFSTSVPTRTLDGMKDFPGIRHVINSTPALKTMAGHYLPNSNPAKDLSVSENVSSKFINTIDILDPTGSHVEKRIHIKNHQKAPFQFLGGKGNRLKSLKRLAVPGALTGLGAAIAYNAITGKNFTDAFKKKTDPLKKEAAVDPAHMAKLFAIPAAVYLAAVGTNKLYRDAIGLGDPPTLTEDQYKKLSLKQKLLHEADALRFSRKTMVPTGIGSGLVGGGLGALAGKNSLGPVAGGALGAYLSGPVGGASLAAAIPRTNELALADPENVSVANKVISAVPAGRDWLHKHPELGTHLGQAALLGLGTALPYYAAKKYYPYHTQKYLSNNFDKVVSMVKKLPSGEVRKGALGLLGLGGAVVLTNYAQQGMAEAALRGAAHSTNLFEKKKTKK